MIDIDGETYKKYKWKNNGVVGLKWWERAIANGTPIPDNATNGDVIKALFHNIKYEEGYVYVKSNTYKNVIMTVREDWWNALYKAKSENEE